MTDPKQKIMDAAVKEFAAEGFGGARMDRIAKNAGVNKAMIFYYYSSKKNLYKSILNEIMSKIFGPMSQLLARETTAQGFLEKIPELQIKFFSQHQYFLRIIALDLMRNPENVRDFFREFFGERYDRGPGKLMQKVKQWYDNGDISEQDPIHFVINVMSLNIYFFIGKPVFEAIFDITIDEEDDFIQERIASVVNLLKRGMLK